MPGVSAQLASKSLAALKELAENEHASPLVLDQAASTLLTVDPASLRNPQLAIRYAEREVAMSHETMPSRLLTLAQAYMAGGQVLKARATARKGLALLPSLAPGAIKPNIRKQLEVEAQNGP